MKKYLIIGAGPAGLSSAVALQKENIPFEIVDAGNKVGGIWDINRSETPMYDSAHFISSKTLSAFEDFPMPEHYPDYPSHRLIQAYIELYAQAHQLNSHIRFQTKVIDAIPNDAQWEVTFDDGTSTTYAGIICATGITWYLNFPNIQGEFEGEYIHSFHYKSSDLFKNKRVLIIGGGNSGCDIACDAAKAAERAFISLRRGYYFIPKYLFGTPTDVYKSKFKLPKYLDVKFSEFLLNKVLVGKLERFGLQKPDHSLMQSHPIMNNRLLHYLGHGDITAKQDIKAFEGKTVIFKDGSREEVDVIVAATGYKRRFPFLNTQYLDLKEENGEIDLYLEIFSKSHNNLFFVGGIEVSSGIYGLLCKQGKLVASYLKAQQNQSPHLSQFQEKKKRDGLNLRGKSKYINTERHARYVDKDHYLSLLQKQLKSFA